MNNQDRVTLLLGDINESFRYVGGTATEEDEYGELVISTVQARQAQMTMFMTDEEIPYAKATEFVKQVTLFKGSPLRAIAHIITLIVNDADRLAIRTLHAIAKNCLGELELNKLKLMLISTGKYSELDTNVMLGKVYKSNASANPILGITTQMVKDAVKKVNQINVRDKELLQSVRANEVASKTIVTTDIDGCALDNVDAGTDYLSKYAD